MTRRIQRSKPRGTPEAPRAARRQDAASSQLPPAPATLPLAVYDIDGVLADVRHRLHYVEGRKRWDLFFAASERDGVLEVGVRRLRSHLEECEIVLLTGRPESERHRTERWLATHEIPYHQLWMRPGADRRPARILKPELLAQRTGGREIRIVVDDDQQIVTAMARAGHAVLHAQWMRSAPRFARIQEETGRS